MDINSEDFSTKEIDLKVLIGSYLRHWKWFVLSVLAAMALAFVYIRYATPEYAAKAKIQILDDKGSSSELSVFKDLEFLGGGKNNVEDEIEILNSRANFIDVVKDLDLNVRITALGNIKDSEIYKNRPFLINFIEKDSVINRSKFDFFIEINSETTFGYSEEADSPLKVYSYGKTIASEIGDIVIIPNYPYFKGYKGKKIRVSIRPVFDIAENYQGKLAVSQAEEFSNILNISLNDAKPEKAVDIINSLVYIFNKNASDDKKEIADKTSEFIDDRIQIISGTLSSVDEDAQKLMTDKQMTGSGLEVGAAVQMSAQSRAAWEQAKNDLTTVGSYRQYLQGQSGYDVMPSLAIGNPSLAEAQAKYNELAQQRKRLLESSTEQSPVVQNLSEQLNDLKRTITGGLGEMENSMARSVSALQGQMGSIYGTISSAPKNQADLSKITRVQQTSESLYLYLLQKREEAQITFASSTPKSRVIDDAYVVGKKPIKPKKMLIYLAAMILGFLLPLSIIYARDLLDNKVQNKNELEKLAKDIPVLAELPKLSKKDAKLVSKDDRSVLGESLRILRTNLDYLIKSKSGQKNNVIFVTSSVPGEGKTFLSSNLSMIFANTDKKVLLIGADIRNPKLYTFYSSKDADRLGKPSRNKSAGLTEFLYDDSLTSKDIIVPMLVHTNTIDVIYSGKIPPNPAELLMSSRMKGLIEEMSAAYDYVVVDTAPLMVVTDTLLISDYADHILYVTRAGVTETRVLEFPLKLRKEGKLKGLSFVVNDVKEANLGYGGKYGYGYGKSTKKWWKF